MNRAEFQQLAQERAQDAHALLDAGRWSGAYYLAGYAVECALKACIARMTVADEFPDRVRTRNAYTHAIEDLVKTAGLTLDRSVDVTINPLRAANWSKVKDWTEESRYTVWSEVEAIRLYNAVTDPSDGVLVWIMDRW